MKPTGPGQSALLLLDVVKVLNKFRVPYAIVGAFAASFYGIVRASLDADALITVRGKEAVEQLCSAFKKNGLKVDYRRGDAGDPVKAVIHIRDHFKNRVDLLTGIRGMRNDVFERVEKTRFMDSPIKVVSREDFIAMKIFAGSPKDIQDVIGVLGVSTGKIDLPLLKSLTADYGEACVKTLAKLLKTHR